MKYLFTVTVASLLIMITQMCTSSKQVPVDFEENDQIFINQLGYLTDGPKMALFKEKPNSFQIIDENGGVVYKGNVSTMQYWDLSGDSVCVADFSAFKTLGKYRICDNEKQCSFLFEIGNQIYNELADAALKSFYFARCSYSIEETYGGKWNRPSGHPDTAVYIHESAADKNRPPGTKISSPGGWYDAGDYGKYVVNSSITTWTLLQSLQINSSFHKDQRLNIPESDNNLPDVLDEALINLQWMMSMQDPNDGGVYHKLTTKSFDGFKMPDETNMDRYVVQKSTAATLDFAATMANASRILNTYDQTEQASKMKSAALVAWDWAIANPDAFYKQPNDISTGAYPDTLISDEWFWAASELYLLTEEPYYKSNLEANYIPAITPKWDVVHGLGIISLLMSDRRSEFPEMEKDYLNYINLMLQKETASPYMISMDKFAWGSNSDVANDGMLKIIGYHLKPDDRFIKSALNDLHYLLGRNTTGYSFVTGFGSKTPLKPHNRIISSDGVDEPIPGYIVGGPNTIVLKDCSPQNVERSVFPAASYTDTECSFSTNETAINWNAPLVFLLSGISSTTNKTEIP